MDPRPGTYLLILRSHCRQIIPIGKIGEIEVKRGYYLYVGSAFGPGGIRARVRRHCRINQKKHWHLDYLREATSVIGAWYSYDPVRLEHEWASALEAMTGINAVPGFGCTDCSCNSHLFHGSKMPSLMTYSKHIKGHIETWLDRAPA